MDSLRVPRERGQKPWDWRRESPVRPVVFQDPGEVTDEVVHLFLEHRIVQRLLGRFISQGFVYDDLSRACLVQTRDAIPRVLLTGRLALYGPGAARLHEELIVVSARWTDPATRRGTLELQSAERLPELRGVIRELERAGELDRAVESLPDEETLNARRKQGLGLTRPELAVVLAYAKMTLNRQQLASELPE
ncbi:MAG: hypothetical protein ACK58J_12540, partial [Planctomyces sp.]